MPTEMCGRSDNRAVSAFFRVFGGAGRRRVPEAGQRTGFPGMHVAEQFLLAIWIPLSVFVAVADPLCRWLGSVAGIPLAFPAAFFAVNLLPCVLPGKTPVVQWRLWLTTFLLWSLWRRDAGGVTGLVAWGWIGLFVLNVAAFVLLGFGKAMDLTGRVGMLWRAFLLAGFHVLAIIAGWLWGWPWAFAGGTLVAGLYCLAVLRPGCQWLGPVVRRTGDRSILVTIDDGPDSRDTPRLLDLLDEFQMKAVFFMIGEKVSAYPELAKEVIRRGHEIGNHTMSHPQASFWCAGPWRTWREISKCQQVIEDATGVKPRWFRAPVGHRNIFTHPVAGMLGLKVMAWNRRGFDAVEKDAEKVLARILPNLGPGDIVLLHEATPIAGEVLNGVLEHLGVRRDPPL